MISSVDKHTLRKLAKHIDEISNLPIMDERKKRWYRHNALEPGTQMILCSPEGAWRELLPSSALKCEGEAARRIEYDFRQRIYSHDYIDDDSVIDKRFRIKKRIAALDEWWLAIDWGLPIKHKLSTAETGSYAFAPSINTTCDLNMLRVPTIEYDEKTTISELDMAQELFGDIMDVQLVGVDYVIFHIMYYYVHYRGLEQTYLDFYDEPEMARELIGFFERGYNSIVDQLEKLDLLHLNNDGIVVSTGGVGSTTELPAKDFAGKVRPIDMWAAAEAQELAPVSPEQSEEFVISAERRLLSRFGLNGYGCCEPLDRKLQYVLSIPNMRRISISPFSDVKTCAEQIGKKCVFSWKPSPFFVSGLTFDEEAARKYIANGLQNAKDTVLEMILADTHTCNNDPKRFTRWVQICREEINKK